MKFPFSSCCCSCCFCCFSSVVSSFSVFRTPEPLFRAFCREFPNQWGLWIQFRTLSLKVRELGHFGVVCRNDSWLSRCLVPWQRGPEVPNCGGLDGLSRKLALTWPSGARALQDHESLDAINDEVAVWMPPQNWSSATKRSNKQLFFSDSLSLFFRSWSLGCRLWHYLSVSLFFSVHSLSLSLSLSFSLSLLLYVFSLVLSYSLSLCMCVYIYICWTAAGGSTWHLPRKPVQGPQKTKKRFFSAEWSPFEWRIGPT